MSQDFKKLVRLDDRVFWIDLSDNDNWEFKELKSDGSSIDGTTAEFLDAVENGISIGNSLPSPGETPENQVSKIKTEQSELPKRILIPLSLSPEDALKAVKAFLGIGKKRIDKYYDYGDGLAVVEKDGKFYLYQKDGSLVPKANINREDLFELPQEVFEKWITEGHWELGKAGFSKEPPTNHMSSDVRQSFRRFSNRNPLKDDLNLFSYKTVGEFYEDAKAKGYRVPVQMCHGLSRLIEAKGLTFQEAYMYLLHKKKIILEGKIYIYDLSGNQL